MNIGDFYIAKVYITYNNHMDSSKSYKWRPVLIMDKVGKYYKCIPITSQVSDYAYDRIDVYTDYNMSKHSQIKCGEEVLILERNFRHYLSTCKNDDFDYIVKKHYRVKKEKVSE